MIWRRTKFNNGSGDSNKMVNSAGIMSLDLSELEPLDIKVNVDVEDDGITVVREYIKEPSCKECGLYLHVSTISRFR